MQYHYLFFSALFLLFFSVDSTANASAAHQSNLFIEKITYIEDATYRLDKESALQQLQAPNNNTVDGNIFNLGNTQTRYWLLVNAKNRTDKVVSVRLLASVPYRALLKVIDTNHMTRPILNESMNSSFDQRQNQHRLLNSSLFEIGAQQNISLLIEYEALGSSFMPLSLVRDSELNNTMLNDSVNAAFFYSFSLATIIIFLLYALAMMNLVSAMYGLLFMLSLLLIASMEGYAFKYIWPQLPQWNNLSPLVLIYLVSAYGLLLASLATLENSKNNIITRLMQTLAAVSFILGLLCFVLPFIPMQNLASVSLGIMFLCQAYAIGGWTSLKQKRNLVAIITAVLLAVFVITILILSLDPALLSETVFDSSPRLIYTLGSLATMATIFSYISGLRQDHEKSLENQLVLMKREAETNKALFEAEQNFSRAKEIARLRQEQLATASHDLRQPLVSLRATMDAIANNESNGVKEQLRNAFDYLENLCNKHLRETHPDSELEVAKHESEQTPAESTEPYSANLIIDTCTRMFADEAQQKGLVFKSQASTIMIAESPLIIMRIVANLLSNAIKNTAQGKILLGVRRGQGKASIQVLDTGSGMTAEQLATLSQAYEKGPDSTGEGLGQAICYQLAEQNDMKLSIQSTPDKGTCCTLDIQLQLTF